MTIPFNKSYFAGDEIKNIASSLQSGRTSGDGDFTKKCHEFLETSLKISKALLTTSCTDALEMSALLLNVGPGDEILVPSFTFVSTVNAFVLRGAKPIFVDIRPDTLNIDENLIEAHITSKTKAIVPVHYAGVACEMDKIMSIAKKYKVEVVEDNAHGLFGKYKNQFLGTFGGLATQSFHETKNFTCGEGGALLINNPEFITRAEILREKGTNRSLFFRGQVDKYSWVDIGSSFLPSEITAAFLHTQLLAKEDIQSRRKNIWNFYNRNLQSWCKQWDVQMPTIPEHCDQAYHMFYLIMPSLEIRTKFIDHLKSKEVQAVFHYLPLHLSKMGKKFGGKENQCPITEDISDRLVRLPFFNSLTQEELDKILQSVLSFQKFK